jgi:uncharacterized membrane protein
MTQYSTDKNSKESSRVELFSDGVFAIAITLLVLDLIQILHSKSDEDLITICINHWQAFLAFFIGFTTILICWINHHVAFDSIYKIDMNFLWVNGFLLFVVTLTPFSTAVFAEYLQKESTIAVAFFGFNFLLISIAANGICSYAYNHHLVYEEDRTYYQSYRLIYRYAIYYTILAFLICFISTWVAISLYVILFVSFAAPKKLTKRVEKLRRKNKVEGTLKENQMERNS